MSVSDPATEKQVNYAFSLMKNADVHKTYIKDLPDDMPSLDYYLQRDDGKTKTWDWLNGMDRGEISAVIEWLQENS